MKKVTAYIIITILFFAVVIVIASYAAISAVTNLENMNITTNLPGRISFTSSGGGTITSNISSVLMGEGSADNIASTASNVLNVTLTSTNEQDLCCSYDIIWEWNTTSTAKNQYHKTTGAGKEFTLSGSYSEYYGDSTPNALATTTDQVFESHLPDYDSSALTKAMHKATICNDGTSSSKIRMQSWNLSTNFYNLGLNQDAFKEASFVGKAKVGNVSCYKNYGTIADFIIDEAPRSGTDSVSNSPWILTSDRTGEYRYAGKNPDNYIEFNGELWRIIGVMPDMTYCTGEYGTENECDTTATGSLVKIIINNEITSTLRFDYKQTGVGSSNSDYGSSSWSDSQLMLMFNGPRYLRTSYNIGNYRLHDSYTIENNIVKDRNGTSFFNVSYSYLDNSQPIIYVPSSATTSSYTQTHQSWDNKINSASLEKIATVKWDLYGTSSYTTAAEGSPAAFYDKERNINNSGEVWSINAPVERRPIYWYGKVGLMYPSDYGYATGGGTTYNRAACLAYQMSGWNSGNYKTNCAENDYLLYQNVKSSSPVISGRVQATITPQTSDSYYVFCVNSNGDIYNYCGAADTRSHRPVLYLKADTMYAGIGTGKWNDPYKIRY